MTLSLNEVESTAKKATRGAGYPWGLAEEAGKATRWLCARNLDGCAALAQLLARTDGADLVTWMPRCDGPVWSASGGRLCPLLAGAALSDRATTMRGVQLAALVMPLLLIPFAAMAAQQLDTVVQIELPDAMAATDGRAVSMQGLFPVEAEILAIGLGESLAQPLPPCSRAAPVREVLGFLNRLAHRTYAPATEASRLSGAGAGLSDND